MNHSIIGIRVVILLALAFAASCAARISNTTNKPVENYCSLTASEVPAVRGFRVGMPINDVLDKFPHLCKFDSGRSITLYKRTEPKPTSAACEEASLLKSSYFLGAENPELSGVASLDLELSQGILKSFRIRYENSDSEELGKEFVPKTKQALGIAEWTNWETEKSVSGSKPESITRHDKEVNRLLCDKVMIEMYLSKYTLVAIPEGPKVNRATAESRLGSMTYYPELAISTSDKVAMGPERLRLLKQQNETKRKLEQAEDKKKAESFRP